MSNIGHNSDPNGNQLRSLIERIETLEGERKDRLEDIREVYAEAKGHGYDPKIMRKVVRLRAMDRDRLREEEELTDLYISAIEKAGGD